MLSFNLWLGDFDCDGRVEIDDWGGPLGDVKISNEKGWDKLVKIDISSAFH